MTTPLASARPASHATAVGREAALRRCAACSRRRRPRSRAGRARRRRARPAPRRPSAAPASTSTCCSRRPVEAPSAPRIASSRPRCRLRAISRLTALAQAMSRTQATAASTKASVEPTSPTSRDFRSCSPHVAFSFWYDDRQIGNSRALVARSASMRPPAPTRRGAAAPSTVRKNGPLRVGVGQRAGENTAMSRSSGPERRLQHADDRGAGAVDDHASGPDADGSPPNRRCQ